MEAYTGFAAVYDTFMDNIPYEEWAAYIRKRLVQYDIRDGLLLDLGCGTGTLTEIMAQNGYDMIGVDVSEEMLEIAMDKRIASGHDILYLLQDMREFEWIWNCPGGDQCLRFIGLYYRGRENSVKYFDL